MNNEHKSIVKFSSRVVVGAVGGAVVTGGAAVVSSVKQNAFTLSAHKLTAVCYVKTCAQCSHKPYIFRRLAHS